MATAGTLVVSSLVCSLACHLACHLATAWPVTHPLYLYLIPCPVSCVPCPVSRWQPLLLARFSRLSRLCRYSLRSTQNCPQQISRRIKQSHSAQPASDSTQTHNPVARRVQRQTRTESFVLKRECGLSDNARHASWLHATPVFSKSFIYVFIYFLTYLFIYLIN